jgi:hypothetical protein
MWPRWFPHSLFPALGVFRCDEITPEAVSGGSADRVALVQKKFGRLPTSVSLRDPAPLHPVRVGSGRVEGALSTRLTVARKSSLSTALRAASGRQGAGIEAVAVHPRASCQLPAVI